MDPGLIGLFILFGITLIGIVYHFVSTIYLDKHKNYSKPQYPSTDKKISEAIIHLRNEWIRSKISFLDNAPSLIDLIDQTELDSITYSNLLGCFEWKYKRLIIHLRDGFKCMECGLCSASNHVHHKYYLKDKMPWEITESSLQTLCKKCHNDAHDQKAIKIFRMQGNQFIEVAADYDNCPRCNGSGYLPEYSHVQGGICFRCRGNFVKKRVFSHRLKQVSESRIEYNTPRRRNEYKQFLNGISIETFLCKVYPLETGEEFETPVYSDDLPF